MLFGAYDEVGKTISILRINIMLKKFLYIAALMAINANVCTISATAGTSYADKALVSLENVKQASYTCATGTANALAQANKNIDATILARAPWLTNSVSLLTVSKLAVAAAAIAVTGYTIKKVYKAISSRIEFCDCPYHKKRGYIRFRSYAERLGII